MAEPNLYTLKSTHASITYSTSSITGKPQFEFNDQHHDVNATGDQIETLDAGIGTLVTVGAGVSALGNTKVSLLVPRVRFAANKTEAAIKTIAIVTTTQTEGIPPVQQTYQVLNLRGKASAVEF